MSLPDLFQNFFTHRDFLPPAEQLPGTLFTPLQLTVSSLVLLVAVWAAVRVSRRPEKLRPRLILLWLIQLATEVGMFLWEALAGEQLDWYLDINLPLYPCSIYLFALPIILWGRGTAREACYGYACTLGLVGSVVAILYPAGRLSVYSAVSLVGLHTYFYHGTILYASLAFLLTGQHRFTQVRRWQQLFLPCLPSLALSVPANLLNYSPLDSDYMYFTGDFPLVAEIFAGLPAPLITLGVYSWYIFIPALFYLPSYLAGRLRRAGTS